MLDKPVGLTVVHTPPRALDPQRTQWTSFELTTENLGRYETQIDWARWRQDNVLHLLYQSSRGLGYVPPANSASPIGVLEWNAAAYFAHRPRLQLAFENVTDVRLTFNAQPGWEYRVQTSTNLTAWTTLITLSGIMGPLTHVHPNAVGDDERYWRIETREGGFPP